MEIFARLWRIGWRNCLSYAWKKQEEVGGYIFIRKSELADRHRVPKWHVFHLVPHVLHCTHDGQITHYAPKPEQIVRMLKAGPWLDWRWLWNFDGQVIVGDDCWKRRELLRRSGVVIDYSKELDCGKETSV